MGIWNWKPLGRIASMYCLVLREKDRYFVVVMSEYTWHHVHLQPLFTLTGRKKLPFKSEEQESFWFLHIFKEVGKFHTIGPSCTCPAYVTGALRNQESTKKVVTQNHPWSRIIREQGLLTAAGGREILNSLNSVKLQCILSTLLKERGYQAERPRLIQVLRKRKGS